MSKLLSGRPARVAIVLAVLVAVVCAASPANLLYATPAAPQAAAHAVYLPLARNGANTTTPPSPPPADASGALFMQPDKKIAGPSIKVDAQGGMHLAYYGAVPLADKPAATYAYCPPPAAQCGDSRKWSFLAMGDQIDEAQLQLTPEGHPRLLLGYHDTAKFLRVYIYGECDSNCTASESSWAFVAVTVRSLNAASIGDTYLPNRTFALDPHGHPAFAIYDNNYVNVEPDHIGGYYFACQANCTQPGSWTETLFTHRSGYNNELVSQPVLQFTSDGKPRILAMLYPLNGTGENGIYYFSCDGGCDDSASWQRTLVADRGSGPYPTWDLALDGQNRPRVAFYKYDASDGTGQTLFYLWCDASCTSGGSWRTLNLGLPKGDGTGANIELDAGGRPRIAYLSSTSLGYTWCDSACASVAGWRHGYADDDDTMEQDYPIARPITCSAGIWDSYSPSFALDRQGNPRIAYDASYKAYCQYQDPTDPTKPPTNEFHEIWHSVRTVFVPHP